MCEILNDNLTNTYKLNKHVGFAIVSRVEAANSWGHINIFAKGAGHAVAQLDVDYGIDYEPFKVHRTLKNYVHNRYLVLKWVCLLSYVFIYYFLQYRIILLEITII